MGYIRGNQKIIIMLKSNIFKFLLIAFFTFSVTSCGDEQSDKLEDQLEERSDELEDRSDDLEDAADDLEDATDEMEDAIEEFEDALEELDDPEQRERIRERVNKMIDDMNARQM